MRIAIYAPDIWVHRGYEHLAPPEAATPFRAAMELLSAGHDVSMITTAPLPQRDAIPSFAPKDLPFYHIDPAQSPPPAAPISRLYRPLVPLASMRLAEQLRITCQGLLADMLHVFGTQRDARVGSLVRLVGFDMPVIATLTSPARDYGVAHAVIAKRLLKRLSGITVATTAAQASFAADNIDTHVVRHGPSPLPAIDNNAPKDNSVLYWGYATADSGCDIAVEVFKQLAPQHPGRTFEIAILVRWEEIKGLDEVASSSPNINVHRFPNQTDPTLESLIASASCTLLPYRQHPTDPPGELLTSLAAGTAVVTTEIGSTPEIVTPTRTALLTPPNDIPATRDTLAKLLESGDELRESLGKEAAAHVAREWSWDHYAPRMQKVYETAMSAD